MAEKLVGSRRAYNAQLSPAVSSRYAREHTIGMIETLSYTEEPIIDPALLGFWSRNGLKLAKGESRRLARDYGVEEVARPHQLSNYGFGDRHFTGQFAGAIAKDVGVFLGEQKVWQGTPGLIDYAKMMQTTWFGSMLNSMAMTRPGLYQSATNTTEVEPPYMYKVAEALSYSGDPYALSQSPDGVYDVEFSPAASAWARSLIDKEQSTGCPAAHRRFTTTAEQAAFLEKNGHTGLGSASGFIMRATAENVDLVIFEQQEATTVIEEQTHAWGEYVEAYAHHLLGQGIHEGVQATDIDQVLSFTR